MCVCVCVCACVLVYSAGVTNTIAVCIGVFKKRDEREGGEKKKKGKGEGLNKPSDQWIIESIPQAIDEMACGEVLLSGNVSKRKERGEIWGEKMFGFMNCLF